MSFALVSLLAMAAAPGADRPVTGEVTYVHAERVFLDIGRAEGVEPGTELQVRRRRKQVARLEVLEAADHTSVARVVSSTGSIRPGNRARAIGETAPVAPPTPVRRRSPSPAADWGGAEIAKVEYHGSRPVRALRRVRSSAHLRGAAWVYLENDTTETTQRNRLRLAVSGPVDDAGRFWVDADLDVVGQPVVPEGARFRADEPAWVDVYRAELGYRNGGLAVGLGRASPGRLRFGLVDGASLSYRFDQGPRIGVAAGLRPGTITLAPGLDKPTAVVDVSGNATTSWGLLSYAWSASWLGFDGGSEGAESMAQLGLGIGGLWLHAETGLFLLTPEGDSFHAVVDRTALSASLPVFDQFVARLAVRRVQDPDLPSERTELPSGYLGQGPTYNAAGSIDGVVARWHRFLLYGRVGAGGGFAEDDHHWHGWATPSVTLTASEWWRMRLQLGYRLELGWVGGQHVEGMVGVEPWQGVRVDILQSGGVFVPTDTGEALPAYATWLRLSAALTDWLGAGVRMRASYGEAGRGVHAGVWLSAHDVL